MLRHAHALLLASVMACVPASAAELPPEAKATWATLQSVQHLQASFVQTQHRAILSTPLVSAGRLAYERPEKLLWQVKEPAPSTFLMRGAMVQVSYPMLGATETVDLATQPDLERLVRGLTVWLGGTLEELMRDYEVTWVAGPPAAATLVPREERLQTLVASMVLTIGGSPVRVEHVLLLEPGGDRVEIALDDVRVGTPSPALFELAGPK